MQDDQDFALPSLAPHLKLSHAPDEKGEPSYTLHNPVANTYFKIDWIAFECISRMPFQNTAQALKEAVESETTLKIGMDDIKGILSFLSSNGLLSLKDQQNQFLGIAKTPLWKNILHQYLYFSIPLFRPQNFLERTYPKIAWMFKPLFLKSCLVFLALMVLITLPRIDEFFHTFSNLFSAEGALGALLVFSFVKIVHEFAHAYTAVRYGVKVPHMGVAIILMYPVLYTETTGSWALSSRIARFHIGMAGVCAELCLAGFFLALWHIFPSGSMAQSLSFLVVSISLISSLLVNLNPFMRFDGYYMFSDMTGFDNLQTRSCNFARHALRKFLFGWNDPAPENLSAQDQKFLSAFGFALLTYRFFLFSGIALLVYHLFFQPLGFMLMMVELIWFIALPIWSEIKVWNKNKSRIFSSKRSLVPASMVFLGMLVFFMPWRTNITLPAVAHAGLYEVVYPPSPSRIVKIHVHEGSLVNKGDILAELDSPELDYNINEARQSLKKLEALSRRDNAMTSAPQGHNVSEVAIEKARLKLDAYIKQAQQLKIMASFSGVVRDFGLDVSEGRYIAPNEALFTLVDPQSTTINAYATEEEREKIAGANAATFTASFKPLKIESLSLARAADTGSTEIPWPELASIHGGPVPSDKGEDGVITTRRTLYEITAKASSPAPKQIERGYLKINAPRTSLFSIGINRLLATFRREGKV